MKLISVEISRDVSTPLDMTERRLVASSAFTIIVRMAILLYHRAEA